MAKRRGDGEGSIYQVRDRLWRAEISLGYTPDGKANRKVLYGATRALVAAKLKEKLRDQQLGQNVKPEAQTVSTYLAQWLKDVVAVRNAPLTAQSYGWLVRKHLIPGLGRHKLEQLSPQLVQQFLAERHAAGLSAATIKHLRATLRAALSQAERWGLVHRNVAKLVTIPQAPRYEAAVLTAEDGVKFLTALRGHPREAVYAMALTMGLRRGELLGLRWADVDLMTAELQVRTSLRVQSGKGLVLGKPKSSRSVRKLRMPQICTLALAGWQVQQRLEKQWAGTKWTEGNFVFTDAVGGPLHPDLLSRDLPRLLKSFGLPVVRLHDLRHSCASMLLAMGVHPKLVQETLGHSSYQLTMDTYSHVIPAMRNEVADRMDHALGSTPTPAPTQPSTAKPN